jgi:hypothetical protein
LEEVRRGRHELGTHGHTHSQEEIEALNSGTDGKLGFLGTSKSWFENAFGHSPTSFRSPCWCGLGIPAINELARLGYRVDSSATPQRPGIFSHLPFENPWLFTSRKPHWLTEGFLEVPTSTLLLPLASPSFAMLRRTSSEFFLTLLMWEARQSAKKVLVLSFDSHDFDKDREYRRSRRGWRQLVPSKCGGFQWRYWLRTYKPHKIFSTLDKLFGLLSGEQFVTLSDFLHQFRLRDKDPSEALSERGRRASPLSG